MRHATIIFKNINKINYVYFIPFLPRPPLPSFISIFTTCVRKNVSNFNISSLSIPFNSFNDLAFVMDGVFFISV